MPENEIEFTTPMMKQYMEIKKQYPDCLLFFRLGDFYELFMDDAIIGHKVLDITLTGRPRGKDGRIPMAGVPFHAVDSYLAKLIKAGYKVAICEQVTEPDKYGIVQREVIRVVTPGTVTDEKSLTSRENNYIVALAVHQKSLGIACADISTGEFRSTEIKYTSLEKTIIDEFTRLYPTECILSKKDYDNPIVMRTMSAITGLNIYCYHAWDNAAQNARSYLTAQLKVKSLYSTGLEDKIAAQEASAALYAYLKETQKEKLYHIKSITELHDAQHMLLDRATVLNLELFSPLRESPKVGTLISVLDNTSTAMGGRLMRQWITQPLVNSEKINERLDAVQEILTNISLQDGVSQKLQLVPDIERIASRISVGIGNARDLVSLKNALVLVLEIAQLLKISHSQVLQNAYNELSSSEEIKNIIEKIENTILEEPSFDVKDGGIIKEGVSTELDLLRNKTYSGKEWIASLEQEERVKTGIGSLKIRFNKVFGFYIEISNSHLAHIPSHYLRKQTLVNGERFTTSELKAQEEKILTAEERSKAIEYEIFLEVQQSTIDKIEYIQSAAKAIAVIDCITSFAIAAQTNRYSRPELCNDGKINIVEGRHPVVEKLLSESQFVPNSIQLDTEENQLLVLTGPNMAGKSVFMRQVALITLMAHIGSYVPAQHASITITDRIFVRSGASDMISAGLSTFMVEMVETAYILKHATQNSLIIMDEIGRGTSTYDGISIAWAIAEHIVKSKSLKTKTLFATHYHELQKLEEDYPHSIKNYHMAIHEEDGKPVFLHTIKKGGAAHSFGVAVAQLAGIPEIVVQQAKEMLRELESRVETTTHGEVREVIKREQPISAENTIVSELHEIDIHQMTPLQALNKLAELKNKVKIIEYTPHDFHKAD